MTGRAVFLTRIGYLVKVKEILSKVNPKKRNQIVQRTIPRACNRRTVIIQAYPLLEIQAEAR